jgi:hypothetical protein
LNEAGLRAKGFGGFTRRRKNVTTTGGSTTQLVKVLCCSVQMRLRAILEEGAQLVNDATFKNER